MRILLVAEKEGTAIHRLCVQLQKSAWWHSFRIVCVHPKRPNPVQIMEFERGMEWADVIDFEYWKTAELLTDMYEIKKPMILSHHNPYDLQQSAWTKYKVNVVSNSEQQRMMRVPSTRIDLPVDLDYWTFESQERPEKEISYEVIMVQNRIEGKKGALPVAEACKRLGARMLLVGDVSDPEYLDKIMQTGAVTFYQRISDDELRELYHKSLVHVCNSIDNFESGTLPILESMSCGTPVLTRKIGHVPDLFNGRNMQVRQGAVEDVEDIVNHLKALIDNKALRDEIRTEGNHSLRYRNYEIYARKYSKIYHNVLQLQELVTAIIPTVGTPEQLITTLSGVMSQTYGPMEIIVVDDSNDPQANKAVIEQLRDKTEHTIKFFTSATYTIGENGLVKTYGLARARNKAILEAEGKWLWFVDDRMVANRKALQEFYDRKKEKMWLWGVKDGVKKSFVENFSFVNRTDLILAGAFNEQITQYGGMTQEVRSRWERNGNFLDFVSTAEATTQRKSSAKWTRYRDIAKSKTQCYKLYG